MNHNLQHSFLPETYLANKALSYSATTSDTIWKPLFSLAKKSSPPIWAVKTCLKMEWTDMAENRCRYSKCRDHCKNWRLNVVIVNVLSCTSYCKSEPDTFLRNKKCLFSKASLTFLSDAVAVFILHKNHCKIGIIRIATFHFRGHRIEMKSWNGFYGKQMNKLKGLCLSIRWYPRRTC